MEVCIPYVWITCIACNGTGIQRYRVPGKDEWQEHACTACSGIGKVYVERK